MTRRTILLSMLACSIFFLGSCSYNGSDDTVGTIVTELPTCVHEYLSVSYVLPTCTDDGSQLFRCRLCGKEKTEVLAKSDAFHDSSNMTYTRTPTLTHGGEKVGTCDYCGVELRTQVAPLGSTRNEPYTVSSADLWKYVKAHGSKDVLYKHVRVTGVVKSVSVYSDMTGYYLEGSKGQGLVCWVYGAGQSTTKGSKVTFQGQILSDNGRDSLEITNCEVIE